VPTGREDDARDVAARGDVAVPSMAITYPIKGSPPVLSAAGSAHDSSTVVSRTEMIVGPTEGDSGGVAIAVETVADHKEKGLTPSMVLTGDLKEYDVDAAEAIADVNDALTDDTDTVPAISLIASTRTL